MSESDLMGATVDVDMIRLAVIPGDGVGPEVLAEALPLLEWARARGRNLTWESFPHGADHCLATGETLSEATFARLRDEFDAVLFGAVGDPRIPDGRHAEGILLRLRQELQLAVNWRPCTPFLPSHSPLRDCPVEAQRLEVFRENTEGPYCLQGNREGSRAVDLAIHTDLAVDRLLTEAFRRAQAQGLPLTLAHKANVLKFGHGLWITRFERLKSQFPGVVAKGMHADALLCALIQNPAPFGIIAADNFLGDLISDLTAAFMGGMGMAPSLNYAPHRPFRCHALAEPVHGSAPDLVGKAMANPTGAILSLGLLFGHLGWAPEAEGIERAVAQALRAGAATPDLGGCLSTQAMGAAIRARLS
ncbi:MAG TPA: isocitrate/isopropylmalate family dehydrogenase [Holophagaceae bacterium]|nr:isocitrate/isopropylmalate family dehydrogenase [Holophagaceae bacterium]